MTSDEKCKLINNGECPYCNKKMVNVKLYGDWICNCCDIYYRFIDDMGPGGYSERFIKGGHGDTIQSFNDIIELSKQAIKNIKKFNEEKNE